ncbi:MAG: type II toxin-antitoxin system VapC family toxin [Synergistaceae bacterium]|nr:type II toxin-antitoxin system VapC family toxin [Synergistaceae bacterium]
MKQSVYVETTIPSYAIARTSFDTIIAGRQAATIRFFEFEQHKYDLYISDFVLLECERGDKDAVERRKAFLTGIKRLSITDEIEPLADIYTDLLSIPARSKVDALHLAICCIYKIDILLSWNCKHLGVESMQIVQRHNDTNGIWTPKMTTPDALLEIGTEE